GCEKIMLKQHMLQMQLVSNNQSVFYQSEVFSRIIAYVMNHSRVCDMREVGGKNRVVIKMINSVSEAVKVLKEMKNSSK
ncbi:MAG: hypothetical protein SO071_08405, partial [Prevotella sp.]|nr:hypothetical protein [Prevotella sp.]